MTPLGHLTVSYTLGKSNRNASLTALVLGGIMPDFDFVFIFFDWFNQVHRVITHNFLFITTAALIAAFFSAQGRKKAVGLSLFFGALVHLSIDSCMDNNPSNGIGVALFWPFSNVFFSPFNILNTYEGSVGWNDPLKMLLKLAPTMLYEVPFYLASLFFIFQEKRSKEI